MPSAKRHPVVAIRILASRFPAMGPGKAALVESIGRTGSISAAARELRMSYRRAWQLVEALNRSFLEPVIATEVGGQRGGGATVTAFGRDMVVRYRTMENVAARAISAELRKYQKFLRHPVKRVSRRSGKS